VADEVIPVLLLLQTSEGHLGAGNVLFGVLEVFEQSLLIPSDTLVDVSGGVGEVFSLTSLTAENAVEVGSDLVGLTGTEGVALSATSLEETSTLFSVAL